MSDYLLDPEYRAVCDKLHDDAAKRQLPWYIDPKSSYMVFTKVYHLERGYCCKSGCRHCPYGDPQSNPPDSK